MPTKTRSKGIWQNGLYVLPDRTIVGSIERHFAHDDVWYAYGCLSDWQDTNLGVHNTAHKAKAAVQSWVREALD